MFLTLALILPAAPVAGEQGPPRGEPAVAALAYLEKIAAGRLDLDVGADTAISPHASPVKQREIAGRVERMAFDLKGGGLEPGEVRVDGGLAGVIVHKTGGYNPEDIAAFAVALLREPDGWTPAPVPASFENTRATLDLETRRRAISLERWMLRQQARALDTLRDSRLDRLREDIAGAISREDLESMDVGDMARAFLEACRMRDLLRLLGMLGGLSEPLPRDWSERMRMVGKVMEDLGDAPPGWRAAAAPEVARVVVHEESGARDGLFSIAFIDPAGEIPRGGVPPVQLVHIDMERDGQGAWRLNLPGVFTHDRGRWAELSEEENPFDSSMYRAFPGRLRQAHPAAPQDGADALWDRLQEAMRSETPYELLRLLALPEDDPALARRVLGRATRFWWQTRHGDGGRAVVPLAFQEDDGGQAMAMGQLFTYREPDRTDLRVFHMIRTGDGWMWQSTGRDEPEEPISGELAAWRDEQRNIWLHEWTGAMLAPVEKLEKVEPDAVVPEADADGLVSGFLAAVAAGDLEGCLERVAVLDDAEGHNRLLRNLGYELSTRLPEVEEDRVVRSGDHWTVVACRREGDVNPGMALFPVVATAAGPRVLLELDLFVGTRRRDFLNNVALERLDDRAPAEVREDLRGLLDGIGRD